jgi:hypothetical protein
VASAGNTDPALDEQLYGPPIPGAASLADTPWSWVPPYWNDAGGGGTQHVGPGDAAAPGSELPAPAPPPVTPTPVDAGPGAGADAPPSPSPAPVQQPGLGIPAAAFDAASSSPPLPPVGPPGAPPAFPAPPPPAAEAGPAPAPGPVPSDVPALQHLPFGLAGSPPIAPEQLDTTAAASGGLGSLQEGWAADPLHAPDSVAQDWAQSAGPLDVLEQKRRLDEARETKRVLDQSRADEENLRQIRADITARQKADAATQAKSDQIVADAIKLSQAKVDPDRWMSTRSGGQKLAALIAVIAGGLYQGRTGGARNIGMDMIQQHIDRDIEAQKQDIESGRYALGVRQNQVAQEFARTGNLYEAAEKVRLATYQAAINRMQTEQQNFDPRGTGWLNYAASIQDMRGRSAQAGEAMRKTIFEEQYKVETLRQTVEQHADQRWKDRQEVALGWAKEARESGKDKADNTVWNPDQLRALNTVPGVPPPPVPPIKMTQAEYTKWLGTQKEGEQYKAAARANSPEERNREFAVGEIQDNTGSPVQFRSTSAADKIAASKGAVDSGAELVDKIIAARRKYGWSADLVKSPEWQQMQANYGQLVLSKKNVDQLGVLSEGDMELIGKALGTKDPTEVRDPTPGLKEARANMVGNLNAQIRAQAVLPAGRTLRRWEPPVADLPESKPDVAQERLTGLLAKPNVSYDTALQQAVQFRRTGLSPGSQLSDDESVGLTRAARTEAEQYKDISPQQRRDLMQLQLDAEKDPHALDDLKKIAKDSHSKVIRELASSAASIAQARIKDPDYPLTLAARPADGAQ